MTTKNYNILILCTGNSARSIMAEGLFNVMSNGLFKAYSAGSKPTGKVNPFAIEQLKHIGYPIESLRSKSWDEFTNPNAPQMDFVITVCDNAASEPCPVWMGAPFRTHWGFEDPASVQGTEDEKRAAFKKIFLQIRNRIDLFLQLPITHLDHLSLKKEMDKIGKVDHL